MGCAQVEVLHEEAVRQRVETAEAVARARRVQQALDAISAREGEATKARERVHADMAAVAAKMAKAEAAEAEAHTKAEAAEVAQEEAKKVGKNLVEQIKLCAEAEEQIEVRPTPNI
eukprot:9370909-Pyramimonas_sp.AAC.1